MLAPFSTNPRPRRGALRAFAALLCAAALFAGSAPRAADDDLDFDDEAFEELDVTPEEAEPEKTSFVDVSGMLGFLTIVNINPDAREIGDVDWGGFSGLAVTGDLQLDFMLPKEWKLRLSGTGYYDSIYHINGRDDYPDDFLDEYESELEIFEAYIQGSLTSRLDLKMGRQIINWGYADSFRVVDVLNPMDLRLPGTQEIEDLRLPRAMTALDYYFGDWSLSGILVHERRFSKVPVYGSDFYPVDIPAPPSDDPDRWGWDEYGVSLVGALSGLDLSLRYAHVYEDQQILEIDPDTSQLTLVREMIDMIGGGIQGTVGSWLFKGEAAYVPDFKTTFPSEQDTGRIDGLIGIEYYGFSNNQTVAMEAVHRHIIGWEPILEGEPENLRRDRTDLALRYTAMFLNERLDFTLLGILFGVADGDGGMYRASLEFEYTDSISMLADLIIYQGGEDPVFDIIRNNDRFALRVQYHF